MVQTMSRREGDFPIDYTIDIPPEYLAYFSIAIKLPRNDWNSFWDKIFVPSEIKTRLLNYLKLLFRTKNKGIEDLSLALHRLLLLYGPPGTGKTSLARGLANVFAQTLYNELNYSGEVLFFEISAPSVLSKYLGETPKFINLAFTYLNSIADDNKQVIVLVDEVESLLVSRGVAISDVNPIDVFRGINETLNQLDLLSRNDNLYLITTSNYPKALDEAFVDRVDLLIRIDLPNEKMRKLIIEDTLSALESIFNNRLIEKNDKDYEKYLQRFIKMTEGLSGRRIRKLFFEILIHNENLFRNTKNISLSTMATIMESLIKHSDLLNKDIKRY